MAIDHQIPILPLTFFDNKKRFSYAFFSGSPGKMRAYIHKEIPTQGLTQESKKVLKEKTYNIILNTLQNDLDKKK